MVVYLEKKRKKKNKLRRKNEILPLKMPTRHRNNIVLVKLARAEKVTLQNVIIFYAKDKRVKKEALTSKVTFHETYL